MKKSVSWGNYPKYDVKIEQIDSNKFSFKKKSIPYGNGRSYGDSCINDNLIDVKSRNSILNFDKKNGSISVEGGVLVDKVIEKILPEGWFLPVVAGTKFITIGGAIASDVHGKNHHIDGCFSNYVEWFKLLMPNGSLKKCSTEENKELFIASCGGMGLTGVIIEAKLKLKKISSSNIFQTTIKSKNLKETFEIFDRIKDEPFSVAWIDSLSKGENLGRSIINYGEFMDDGYLNYKKKFRLNIPFNLPSFCLNNFTIRIFNFLYYNRVLRKKSSKKTNFDSFFFPLDVLKNWNRIYGEKGFLQYQFIIPIEKSYDALFKILQKISESGKGSFLAVLKLYGKENENYLSFPLEGYSLALDFKIEDGIFDLLDDLDKVVLEYDGRIYLSKDSRVSKSVFESGYPRISRFRQLRKNLNLEEYISSIQSERLGI